MNTLAAEKKLQIVNLLVEGTSIRSIEHMTGVHRDTIMRLGLSVGKACATFLDSKVKNVKAQQVQVDEIWNYVFKKQGRISVDDSAAGIGDQYVFVGIDAQTKLVISHLVGKRDASSAYNFMVDLKERVTTRIQLTTDGFKPYIRAVDDAFGADVDYAQLIKIYGSPRPSGATARSYYEPSKVVGIVPVGVMGNPRMMAISTSHVERQNLTMRMSMRRMNRLTNGFSKKLENLKAAIALHFANYNFVRVHQTIRVTPAMHAGIADHVWNLQELLAYT